MLYRLQKKEIPKAGIVLADAFQHDPLWNKILEGESNIEQKFQACFETPVKYCYKFGEVYASSENLEGVAAWISGNAPDMTFWRMIQSGAFLPGMRMGSKVGKKIETLFKPILGDRHENMKGKSYIYLLVIGVATEFQGQGFGGKMMRELIEKCEQLGNHLYLETEVQRNVEMYEKYGFKTIKQITLPIVNHPMWEMIREPRVKY
jgi:ribosomal protein S18 acetylase RimI-like enzyme